jgi:hypothetical protein
LHRARGATLISPLTVVVGLLLGVLVTLSSVSAGARSGRAVLHPRLSTVEIVGSDISTRCHLRWSRASTRAPGTVD